MKSLLLVNLMVFCSLLLNKSYAVTLSQIEIGTGDVISVEVYNEPDLTVKTKVDGAGLVKFPLIGDIKVTGKNVHVLAAEIETAYKDGYLVSPNVAVKILSFRPFYIRGAVNSSGAYPFEFDLTVEKAIAVARGLKDRASQKEWYILRGENKSRILATKDTQVLPGDIIEIKESLF